MLAKSNITGYEFDMSARGEANRRHIIATADRLFYQRGYNQTSFSDIADAAGIPRGNFYYYFKTKDEILAAVVDDRIERIRTTLADWDRREPDPRRRLKRFLRMLHDSARQLVRYGCPMGSLNVELGKAQPALKAKARKMFDLYRDWLTAQFHALGRHREAGTLALHLLGRAQGIAVVAQVYADRQYLTKELGRLRKWLDAQLPPRAGARHGARP